MLIYFYNGITCVIFTLYYIILNKSIHYLNFIVFYYLFFNIIYFNKIGVLILFNIVNVLYNDFYLRYIYILSYYNYNYNTFYKFY